MDNEQERQGRLKDSQREQLSRLATRLALFQSLFLCGYDPGETFWDYVLPGRAAEMEWMSFREGYGGTIPDTIGAGVDRALIGWASGATTRQEADQEIAIVITDLHEFQNKMSLPEHSGEMVALLLDELAEIRNTTLRHDRNRDDFAKMVQELRTELMPGYSKRGDRPLGRG